MPRENRVGHIGAESKAQSLGPDDVPSLKPHGASLIVESHGALVATHGFFHVFAVMRQFLIKNCHSVGKLNAVHICFFCDKKLVWRTSAVCLVVTREGGAVYVPIQCLNLFACQH
mmetsp:Transcript_32408/g.97551  ORF Transcript_32408/g.97551 Transcript_32408/m.97551 type:complete len:115 (+) Transcript_32408:299-643(+)